MCAAAGRIFKWALGKAGRRQRRIAKMGKRETAARVGKAKRLGDPIGGHQRRNVKMPHTRNHRVGNRRLEGCAGPPIGKFRKFQHNADFLKYAFS